MLVYFGVVIGGENYISKNQIDIFKLIKDRLKECKQCED